MRSLLLMALCLFLHPADTTAQVASAELFINATAGTNASDENVPSDPQSFHDGPRTTDITLLSDGIPILLQSHAGGADGKVQGQINYLAAATQITTSGTFHVQVGALGEAAAALANVDATLEITFQTAVDTPYHISGHVKSAIDLSNSEVVTCQVNGTVLAGDTRATPLMAGVYPFTRDGTAAANEPISVECAAAWGAGATSTVGFSNDLEWELTVNFGSTTTTSSTPPTTLVPPTKKQCRKRCAAALKSCKLGCSGIRPNQRACNRQCKQRRRGCGLATGCMLRE